MCAASNPRVNHQDASKMVVSKHVRKRNETDATNGTDEFNSIELEPINHSIPINPIPVPGVLLPTSSVHRASKNPTAVKDRRGALYAMVGVPQFDWCRWKEFVGLMLLSDPRPRRLCLNPDQN